MHLCCLQVSDAKTHMLNLSVMSSSCLQPLLPVLLYATFIISYDSYALLLLALWLLQATDSTRHPHSQCLPVFTVNLGLEWSGALTPVAVPALCSTDMMVSIRLRLPYQLAVSKLMAVFCNCPPYAWSRAEPILQRLGVVCLLVH